MRSFGFQTFCSEQVAHAEECVVHVHGAARHGEILSVGFRQSHLGADAEDEFSVVGMKAECQSHRTAYERLAIFRLAFRGVEME